MDIAERIIKATVAGGLTDEESAKLLDVHTIVCRQITCPVTGKVLDSRTAILIYASKDLVGGVVHPDGLETALERIAERGITIETFDPAPVWKAINPPMKESQTQ